MSPQSAGLLPVPIADWAAVRPKAAAAAKATMTNVRMAVGRGSPARQRERGKGETKDAAKEKEQERRRGWKNPRGGLGALSQPSGEVAVETQKNQNKKGVRRCRGRFMRYLGKSLQDPCTKSGAAG
jgi:hypothetical protein